MDAQHVAPNHITAYLLRDDENTHYASTPPHPQHLFDANPNPAVSLTSEAANEPSSSLARSDSSAVPWRQILSDSSKDLAARGGGGSGKNLQLSGLPGSPLSNSPATASPLMSSSSKIPPLSPENSSAELVHAPYSPPLSPSKASHPPAFATILREDDQSNPSLASAAPPAEQSPSPRSEIKDSDKGLAFYGIPKFSLLGKNRSLKVMLNNDYKDSELSRAGVMEIEEGKLLKSWKKTKVVVKSNHLFTYEGEKGEKSFGLDEAVRIEVDPKRGEGKIVTVGWSEKSVVFLRSKSAAEASEWLSVLKKNQIHFQRLNAPLTIVDQLLLVCMRKERWAKMATFKFEFLEHLNSMTYLGVCGAILAELFLRHKIKLVAYGERSRVQLFSNDESLTGDSLLDDMMLLIKNAKRPLEIKEILRMLQKPKDAEAYIGDMWRRAIARAISKGLIQYERDMMFTTLMEDQEGNLIDLLRSAAFLPGFYPATPRELSFIGLTYGVIRVMRRCTEIEKVVHVNKVFSPDEIKSKEYLNGLQAAMDRYSHGFGNVDSTAAANIREICSSVYYCGKEK